MIIVKGTKRAEDLTVGDMVREANHAGGTTAVGQVTSVQLFGAQKQHAVIGVDTFAGDDGVAGSPITCAASDPWEVVENEKPTIKIKIEQDGDDQIVTALDDPYEVLHEGSVRLLNCTRANAVNRFAHWGVPRHYAIIVRGDGRYEARGYEAADVAQYSDEPGFGQFVKVDRSVS